MLLNLPQKMYLTVTVVKNHVHTCMRQAYPKCSSIYRLLHPIVISVIKLFVLVFCHWSCTVQVLLFLQKMKLLSLDLFHLSHTAHFQQNMIQKNPNKLPPLFCRMYKTSCFYKLLHQVCSSDSLRTIWSEALEIQVDFKTVRWVNRIYIELPQNFEWSCNLEPLLFLQASWGRQEWNLRNLQHKSFINSETWFVSKK